MAKPLVSVVMGSDSDLEIMGEAGKALDEFGIPYEMDVTSAHRSPDRTADYARKAAGRGIRVIIAGAGHRHLAGTLPESGIPLLHERNDHEGDRRPTGRQRKPHFADPQNGAEKDGSGTAVRGHPLGGSHLRRWVDRGQKAPAEWGGQFWPQPASGAARPARRHPGSPTVS